MRLEELANLHLRQRLVTIIEGHQHALCLLILVVLNVHSSIIRSRGCALLLQPEVNVVQSTVWASSSDLVPEGAFSRLRIVIIVHIHVSVPTRANQMVLSDLFTFFSVAIYTPVDQIGNVLVLIILRLVPLSGARCLVIARLLEALLLHTILHVEAVGAASLVSDEQFALAIV